MRLLHSSRNICGVLLCLLGGVFLTMSSERTRHALDDHAWQVDAKHTMAAPVSFVKTAEESSTKHLPSVIAAGPYLPKETEKQYIFMRPHYFGGKNNGLDKIFVPLCIRSVLKYNPDAEVYLVHNDPSFFLPGEPRFHGILMHDSETDETKTFNSSYVNLSTNPYYFEKYAIMGYFYMKGLMDKLGIEEVMVVETDVLVFCDLWAVSQSEFNVGASGVDALLTKRCVIGSSYITRLYLETYTNVALTFYENEMVLTELRRIAATMTKGGINDMTINDWMGKPHLFNGMFTNMNDQKKVVRIEELSKILPGDDSFFDTQIRDWNYTFGTFETEESKYGLVKKLYDRGGFPYGRLLGERWIKLNVIHFGGATKEFIPKVYNRFIHS